MTETNMKRQMKNLAIMMCGWMLALGVQAQTATQVLDRASNAYKKMASVSAEFEIGISGEKDKGSILLQGNKFCTKMHDSSIWFDGKTMWTYVHDNEEVNVTEPTEAQVSRINPYSFINMYKRGYDVAFGANSSTYYDIVLTARDGKASIQKAILWIKKTDYSPIYIMMGTSRADVEISVISYKAGKKQPDTAFRFDKKNYPKVDVVDLR